jgi:hypothetical protein
MNKKILILGIAGIFMLISSCTQVSRNNPFDPDAVKTKVFTDLLNSGMVGNPPADWSLEQFGGAANFFLMNMIPPAGPEIACKVDFMIPSGWCAMYKNISGSLKGLVFVQFGYRYDNIGPTQSKLAFELTGDTGASIQAGLGLFSLNGTDVDFFLETGLGSMKPGAKSAPGGMAHHLLISILFDMDNKTMSAWYRDNNGAAVQICDKSSVPNLQTPLSRFQFRLFYDGNSPRAAYIDSFSISTL